MKLLKIEEPEAFFLNMEGEYEEIVLIDRESLLNLVRLTLVDDQSEFDEFDISKIRNQAHQIIYQNIYSKLSVLATQRATYKDRTSRQFSTEYETYRNDSNVSTASSEAENVTSK